MSRGAPWLLLFCLACWCGIASAQAPAQVDPLDALIDRSGLDTQLDAFAPAMQEGIRQAHALQQRLGVHDLERLRRAVANAYAPARLRQALRTELASTLAAEEISAALAWYATPAARRLTDLERKAASPEVQQRLAAAAGRGARPLRAGREAILRGLVGATHADELGAALLIETAAGLAEGAALFEPGDEAMLAAARREIEAQRAVLAAAMRERSFITFAEVYAEASDADLAALLRFARSQAGARYHALAAQAFERSLVQAARRLGGALAAPAAPADI